VRFDRERTDSFGYSFFDPAAEREQFDRLNALNGTEVGRNDFQQGNNDNLENYGVLGDPLFVASGVGARQATAYITDPLRIVAIARLTRHHIDTLFESERLGALFPEIFIGDTVDAALLRDLGVSPQQRESFAITNNNLAPRLSVSWDPLQDGRTKLFATWGRFYDRLFLSTIVGEEGPDYLARYYRFEPAGVTLSRDQTGLLIATPNNHTSSFISRSAPSTTQVDRGLRTPFSDEWTLGFQRETSAEVSLSVTYINRRYRDQIQDVDVNHTLRFNPLIGEAADLIGIVDEDRFGASVRIADGRPDLYILNPFFNQILRIGNTNEAYYRGIEVQLTRRLSRR